MTQLDLVDHDLQQSHVSQGTHDETVDYLCEGEMTSYGMGKETMIDFETRKIRWEINQGSDNRIMSQTIVSIQHLMHDD